MEEYLARATAVAHEAGGIISDSFGIGSKHELKDDYSPVTDADRIVNELVIARLSEAFPEHSLVGEEGRKEVESEYAWVFDPIDGTVPFLRGVPTNVFALALVHHGEPVLGVVHDPHTKRLYHATKGGGAYLNGVSIHTSSRTELERSYIETDHHRGFKDFSFFERLHERDVRFLSYSSTIYAQMLVAAGQIEAVVFPGKRPWDAAASKVIVEEAGGYTSDLAGNIQRYDKEINGFICAGTKKYHEKLLEVVGSSLV
ncbi:MAG: inositol monophosphatase family protein [Bacillota bacterium]